MKIYFILMALMSLPAFANDDQVPDFNQVVKSESEWTLLGPAFSKHASLNGAPVVRQASFAQRCYAYDYGFALNIERCTIDINSNQKKWSENNPAIGIERSTTSINNPKSKNKIFASFVHDSYGSPSLLVGAGKQWSVASILSFNVSAGVSAGLWNRTVAENNKTDKICGTSSIQYINHSSLVSTDVCLNQKDTEKLLSVDMLNPESSLKRVTVPFILPYIELVEERSGLGVNIALAPKVKIGRYETVPTTTVMLQFTYRMNF